MEYNPLTRRYWLSRRHQRQLPVRDPQRRLMFSDIQAVLFDLDGTLIDSAPDLGAAADKMRTDRGLPSLPLERYRPMAGAGARGMLGVAFGITPEHPDFAALREEFFVNYESCMTRAHLCVRRRGRADRRTCWRAGLAPGAWSPTSRCASPRPLTQRMPLFATAAAVVGGDTHAPRQAASGAAAGGGPAAGRGARRAASTSATTSATWWRAGPPACARWPRPTATSAATPIRRCGGPHARIHSPLDCCRS